MSSNRTATTPQDTPQESAYFGPLIAEALQRQVEASDAQFRAFEERVVTLFSQENWLITELVTKYSALTGMVEKVSGLIKQLETLEEEEEYQQPEEQDLGCKQLTAEKLVDLIAGKEEFQAQLILKEPIKLPLYRDRNFALEIQLVDMQGKKIEEAKVSLFLRMYGQEYPLRQIEHNNEGNSIFKGILQQELRQGSAIFQRLQVREVTSHFRNGQVYLAVIPKSAEGLKIKPLVINNVVVKAKKMKQGKEGKGKQRKGRASKCSMSEGVLEDKEDKEDKEEQDCKQEKSIAYLG